MALPDSYVLKPNAVPAYFNAILDAHPPERFSLKFLENLGFTSTNDRLFLGVLKDLGFLNRDGAPQPRYFEFLDRSRSKQVLAAGVREGFSDLFGINKNANDLKPDEVKNKLRTLYAGKKTDLVIGNIARTFKALCDYADFSGAQPGPPQAPAPEGSAQPLAPLADQPTGEEVRESTRPALAGIAVSGLQYHINIVLPETRDQGVYDAIFRSLREHLG
jgi:Family of unknown function (DUF5343)